MTNSLLHFLAMIIIGMGAVALYALGYGFFRTRLQQKRGWLSLIGLAVASLVLPFIVAVGAYLAFIYTATELGQSGLLSRQDRDAFVSVGCFLGAIPVNFIAILAGAARFKG